MDTIKKAEAIISKLREAPDREAGEIISFYRSADTEELCKKAASVCTGVHGNKVYLRGLIEFTNWCVQDCHYCGIRKSNRKAVRYRLTEKEIIDAASAGYSAGLKTFVLQGGEDPFYTTDMICRILEGIKRVSGGNAAVTLSLGIRSRKEYAAFREAGADRYLMRFETSDPVLHSKYRNGISLERRIAALFDLKELGFETGSGYMTGLPGETEEIRINNALLCRELGLDMVGIGPFIPHGETPLAGSPQMPFELCVRSTALLRLLLPEAHIPATTAAGSLDPEGREKMISAGANVLMPNITPQSVKKHYLLYPGKICLEESGIDCIGCLSARVMSVNRVLSFDKGSALRLQKQ